MIISAKRLTPAPKQKHRGPRFQLSTQTTAIVELARLYLDEQLPLKAIAERIGVSLATIGNRLRAAGYTLRPRGAAIGQFKHPEVNTADLVQAWRENPNVTAIAERFHLSRPAVVYRLKQGGVEPPKREHKVLPDGEIIRLYVDENRTLEEIAKYFGVAQTTIFRKLTSLGVELRPRTAHMKAWHAAQKAKLAKAECILAAKVRRLPGRPRDEDTTKKITLAAHLLIEGFSKRAMSARLYPYQHNANAAYDSTKKLFRDYGEEIEVEVTKLRPKNS